MTTAQAGLWVSDPQSYHEKMFKLLGDRNPLEVLAQTESTLADIVRTHSATVLRARPFEEKWTPNEVIGHLADSEWVYGYRLRLILCEDNPTILGMNQDLWVAGSLAIFKPFDSGNSAAARRTSPGWALRRSDRPRHGSIIIHLAVGAGATSDIEHRQWNHQ